MSEGATVSSGVRFWGMVGAVIGCLLLAGCETVEPWQKGNLADYTMQSDRDDLEGVMSAHVVFSREASSGGEGVGGGGCGCN